MISSSTSDSSQIRANATLPIFELSATTVTWSARPISARLVSGLDLVMGRQAGERRDAVDREEHHVQIQPLQAGLGERPDQLVGLRAGDAPVTTSFRFGRTASSEAMFSALVTIVSCRRSTSARATSVVVVPPVSPIAQPSQHARRRLARDPQLLLGLARALVAERQLVQDALGDRAAVRATEQVLALEQPQVAADCGRRDVELAGDLHHARRVPSADSRSRIAPRRSGCCMREVYVWRWRNEHLSADLVLHFAHVDAYIAQK